MQIPAPLGKKSLYVKVKNIILSIHVYNKFLRIVIIPHISLCKLNYIDLDLIVMVFK